MKTPVLIKLHYIYFFLTSGTKDRMQKGIIIMFAPTATCFLFLCRPASVMKAVIIAIVTHFLLGRWQSWAQLLPYSNKCNYTASQPSVTDCIFAILSVVH